MAKCPNSMLRSDLRTKMWWWAYVSEAKLSVAPGLLLSNWLVNPQSIVDSHTVMTVDDQLILPVRIISSKSGGKLG